MCERVERTGGRLSAHIIDVYGDDDSDDDQKPGYCLMFIIVYNGRCNLFRGTSK